MQKALAVGVGLAVLVLLWFTMFHDLGLEWRRYERLARSGAQVTGRVTAKEPMNHASIRYEYIVHGVQYLGGPCQAHAEFQRVSVGDSVRVTYLPDSPGISTCEEPQTAYSARSGMLFILAPAFALLGAVAMSFGVYFNYLRPKPRNASNYGAAANRGPL